jgi:hypothetical protein
MICKHCGTEIADKALICYRCGNATTEPRVAPPPARGLARPRRSIAPIVISMVALVLAVAFAIRADDFGTPRSVAWVVAAAFLIETVWLIVRRRRR